jgi:hypothetical protein
MRIVDLLHQTLQSDGVRHRFPLALFIMSINQKGNLLAARRLHYFSIRPGPTCQNTQRPSVFP